RRRDGPARQSRGSGRRPVAAPSEQAPPRPASPQPAPRRPGPAAMLSIQPRALIAIALLTGLYVIAFFAALLSLALLVLPILLLATFGDGPASGLSQVAAGFLGTASMAVVGAILYGFSVEHREVGPTGAVVVTRSDQPTLWALVDAVAAQGGTPAPGQRHPVSEPNPPPAHPRLFRQS